MAYIDRTEEFRLATNVHYHDSVQPNMTIPPPNFSVSNFSKVTASLSSKVSKTTLKLQRLTERKFLFSIIYSIVVRRKSLFDDKSSEINQLTSSIKQDITTINGELEELEVSFISFSLEYRILSACKNIHQIKAVSMIKV